MGDRLRLVLGVVGALGAVIGLGASLVLGAEGIDDGGASLALCVACGALAITAALHDDDRRVIGRRQS